jgi:2-keto-4-pentenoate hydratase/2-oxohepta-3-ene-1,7-dioic acid hydratase in catechol pathway
MKPELMINSIFCIGRNYSEHAKELHNEVPDQPMVFLKPVSAIIGDGEAIVLPAQSREVHHEVELVVAIGKGGRNIPVASALQHVAGYGIGIDVTARDLQQAAKQKSHPWSVAKGFDTFAPISSFIPADAVEHPQNLELKLLVNGELRQHGNTRDMIFPVAELIAYLSTIFTLSAGDLIFTGTPAGVSPINKGDSITATLNRNLIRLNISVTESL